MLRSGVLLASLAALAATLTPTGAVPPGGLTPTVSVVSWHLTGAQGYVDVEHVLLSDGTYLVVDHGVVALALSLDAPYVDWMLEAIWSSGFPEGWNGEAPDVRPSGIVVTLSVLGGRASHSYALAPRPKLPPSVASVEEAFLEIMLLVLSASGWVG